MKRRDIFKFLSGFPFAGSALAGMFASGSVKAMPPAVKRNILKELGVRTFINAAGTYTAMTGSLMHDYVLNAIMASSKDFCFLDELQDKVGEKIAALVRSEAAVVTAGAFSGLSLGLAGILTGLDLKKVEQLPHLEGTGMKSEVICQKGHDIVYNHAFRNTGCKIIHVETMADAERAINEKTALLSFINILADKGSINHEQWVALGKKHNIPTSIDIAADVPPVSNLWKFNEMGFDMVVISGGKAIRGPQSAGLLMGKKDIIAAARLHMPPRGFNIGRGMKINKEEIVGMYVALEQYMSYDHEKEWQVWQKAISQIENSVKSIDGVSTKVSIPPLGNITPTLEISWDTNKIKFTSKELQERLRNGAPSIEVGNAKENGISITAWVMKPGEEKIVARRVKQELSV